MKRTGITRPLDALGRVTIPKELRDSMGISTTDRVEFYIHNNKIVINKFIQGCHGCENEADTEVLGIPVCESCLYEFEKARKLINKVRK